MSSTRNFNSPGIFADDATTTIPPTPIAGVAYRDAVSGTADIENGWRYGTRVDSKDWNQIMFLLTSLAQVQDKQGLLGWTNLTDYAVPAVTFGSNGLMYIAIQPSGPSTTPRDPVSEPAYWEQFASHGIQAFSVAGVSNWTVPMAMQLGYIKPFVTVIGGGGGGGSNANGGGGGGGGGYAKKVVDLTGTPSVTVTVGAGGAGATAGGGTPAQTGGTTSFGAIVTASGGGGATGNGGQDRGAGGSGSLGDVNDTLGPGFQRHGSGTPSQISGKGGGNGGGASLEGGTLTGLAATGFGCGGSGGTGGAAGGAGKNGIVVIEW